MGAVRDALQNLPCVDAQSVDVDFESKEARFNVKKGSKCKLDEIKKAVADSRRGKVGEVKHAPAS